MCSSEYRESGCRVLHQDSFCVSVSRGAIGMFACGIALVARAKMIGVTVDETEKEVCELVTGGFLDAKIDRPAGIIR